MDITDRIVVITGAAGGLGSVVARELAAAGARLALVDRDANRLQVECGMLVDSRGALLVSGIDLTRPESVANMARQVIDRFGRVDALLNIAGGYRAGTPVHETPVETWDFMLSLNARTAFLVSQAILPHMIANGSGKIVNVAARSGLEARTNEAAYAASKAAVLRLTEGMAKEYGGHGINVNAVIPGTIDTQANREAMPNADFSRWVQPAQIAAVLRFLISDAADVITGAAIPVSGR